MQKLHAPARSSSTPAHGDRRPRHGRRRWRAPPIAVGADGLIVEVHPNPENALSDGPQALYAHDFAGFADRVAAHAALTGRMLA